MALQPPRSDIERVSSLRVLGVMLNDKLTAADHVTALLTSESSMLYCTPCECCVAARHIPRNSHLEHPVRGTIVVWHVSW